jgi:hypothetical protein
MLQMSTDLLRVNRLEKQIASDDSWILANAKTGTFVTFAANGAVERPAKGDLAVAIFTESNRDGSAGFTGDVGITGGVTTLSGTYQAVTDQFVGTPAVGDKLYVNADGKLGNATELSLDAVAEAAATQVATCVSPSTALTYLGLDVNVIEFVTI